MEHLLMLTVLDPSKRVILLLFVVVVVIVIVVARDSQTKSVGPWLVESTTSV